MTQIIHIYHTNGDKRELRASTPPADMIQYLTAANIDPNTVSRFDYFPSEEPYFWAYKWDGAKWVIDRRGIELNNWMIDTEKLCGIMQSDDTIRLYHSPMKDPDIFDFASEEDSIEAYKKILAGIKKGDRVVDLNDYRSNEDPEEIIS